MNKNDKLIKWIAENVERGRKRLEISGLELARRAEQPAMTVNDCLKGRCMPQLPLLLAIAKVLGMTVDELVQEPVKTKPRTAKQAV